MPLPYNDTHNDTCDAVEPGHYVGKKLNETSKGFRYIYSMLSAQHAHKPTHTLTHIQTRISGIGRQTMAQQKKTVLNVCAAHNICSRST